MLKITQSLIKTIYQWNPDDEQYIMKDAVCPLRAKTVFLDGIKSPSSSSQAMGNYFEWLIGANPSGEIRDLPRKGKGLKTAAHERLDQQAGAFRVLATKYGLTMQNVQVSMFEPWIKGKVDIGGTMDIFEMIDGVPWNVDVKICANILSDFGEYQWAEPEKKDWLQSKFYDFIWFKKYGVHMKHLYLVFDYAPLRDYPLKNYAEIPYEVTDEDHKQVEYLIGKVRQLFNSWHGKGYPANPDVEQCRHCPLGSRKFNRTELLLHPGKTSFGDGSCKHYVENIKTTEE